MAKGQSLQDPFLNALRKERVPVSIYLVNGIKLQGQIDSFDQFVVLLKNTVSQMVYKHAISTVVPARNVRIRDDEGRSRRRRRETRGRMRSPLSRFQIVRSPTRGERAVLVRLGLGAPRDPEDLQEFDAAGALGGRHPWPRISGRRERPDPRFFVGSGKADEIRAAAASTTPTSILVNHPLSPSRRNAISRSSSSAACSIAPG